MNNLDRAKTIKGFFDRFTEKGYTEELPMIIEWAKDFKKYIEKGCGEKYLYEGRCGKLSGFLCPDCQEAIRELEQVK